MTYFELWHTRTNNFMDDFDSAQEAERVFEEAVARDGLKTLAGTYFVRVDDDGENHLIAEDEAILLAVRRLATAERSDETSPQRHVG
ncbi:MAG: hypothetical protein QM753_04815 [Thermomicrobiales bacterium]